MITASLTGLRPTQRRLATIVARLNDPQEGLERATHKVSTVWRNNFDSGGGAIPGGWPQLAELTMNMREYQGYPPERPILIRYGALRAVAVDFFYRAKAGGAISAGDDYSDNVTTGSLQIRGKTATLHMGGSYKVLNQMGHENARTGPNPARPFWFIDAAVVAAASDGLRRWVESGVLSRS